MSRTDPLGESLHGHGLGLRSGRVGVLLCDASSLARLPDPLEFRCTINNPLVNLSERCFVNGQIT